ncbi:MAG: hypothetical protein FWB78_10665, partial [Treponema sp.]|nr:hypothetical protein [Treponema sp.]
MKMTEMFRIFEVRGRQFGACNIAGGPCSEKSSEHPALNLGAEAVRSGFSVGSGRQSFFDNVDYDWRMKFL